MNTKTIFQSKTLWMSLATICTGIGMYVAGEQELQELVIISVGSVFAVLRFFTNKGIE